MSAAVLVDTSVWVDHFSAKRPSIASRMAIEPVHVHEFILGELLLGTIPRSHPAADQLREVPRLATLSHGEVEAFVALHRLEGSGIGWIDAHLLGAAKVFGARLWTSDKTLRRAAEQTGVAE